MTIIKDRKGQLMLMISIVIVVSMDGLDASIVNVALPSISSSFTVDISTVAWVSVTYFMMMAGRSWYLADWPIVASSRGR